MIVPVIRDKSISEMRIPSDNPEIAVPDSRMLLKIDENRSRISSNSDSFAANITGVIGVDVNDTEFMLRSVIN